MSRCPDHARELAPDPSGLQCPLCRGTLMTHAQLVDAAGAVDEVLEVEARADAIAYKKPRACPDCATAMTPLRIARLEAWVERCPSCERHWVEVSDLRSLKMVSRSQARREAWATLDETERKELAAGVAEAVAPPKSEFVEELTMGEAVRAAFGVPVLSELRGAQPAVATWASLALLALVFIGGLAAPETLGFDALGYVPGKDSAFQAVLATFAHDGWLHLGGNLLFAWLFGDAVERRAPHALVPAALFGMGAMALVIDGAMDDAHLTIGGASGGVYALMGLCAVLQRKGKWLVPLLSFIGAAPFFKLRGGSALMALRVPLPFAMAVYAFIDVLRASESGSGIAWVAHAAGFALGLVGGIVLERLQAD
ncbi:MAG: rhomboid family intramembrane serine protease [Myxococcaceae bacterium]|nr:rhomboid family intramembrane serine protease [Myxococcaceae bacterium]